MDAHEPTTNTILSIGTCIENTLSRFNRPRQEDGNLNLVDVNPNPIDPDMLHNDN